MLFNTADLTRSVIIKWLASFVFPALLYVLLHAYGDPATLNDNMILFLCVTSWAVLAWAMGTLNDVAVGLILPMLYLLRAGIAEKLSRFVENGGVLVGTYWTGVVDENDLCFLGGTPGQGLDAVFGLEQTEIDALYPHDKNSLRLLPDSGLHGLAREYQTGDLCQLVRVTTARTLAEYGAEFYAGTPALTVNSFGNGRAYYIACRTGQDFLNDFLGVLIRDLGLRNLDMDLPANVTVSLRRDASTGREFFFVQNFSDSAVEIALPGSFVNAETGRACEETLSLPAYGVVVLNPVK